MNNFLKTYENATMTQEEMETLDKSITTIEIKCSNIFSPKKVNSPRYFTTVTNLVF